MDPVGPWSYASYNRLTGVSASTTTGELHHLPSGATGGTPPTSATTTTTTTQLLPGGFLSPPPVTYDVFTPFLHHAGSKPSAHYVTQRQSSSKQPEGGEFHQTFFEHNPAWQQNSPFGILPHETVVPTTSAKGYENFNVQFAAQSINHLNSLAAKNATARVQSPQVVAATTKSQGNATFFQVPVTFTISVDNSASKQIYATTNAQNIQQTCIVTSSNANASISGNRGGAPVAGASSRTSSFLPPNAVCIAVTKPSSTPQVQTKAQIKVYPEIANQNQNERSSDEQQQSSPISFSMDAPRLSYANSTSNNTNKRPFQTNYRHYQHGSNNESSDFQRGTSVTTNGNSDCNIAVSRRSSPLQARSQASPIGHAPSPVYQLYNSPMSASISSPQSNSHVTPPHPLDASIPRPNTQSNIAYSSVITRTLNSDKQFPERFERQNQVCWEDRRKFNQYNASTTVDVVTSRTESIQRQSGNVTISEHPAYFDSQVPLQDLSSCRGDPMSIVKNLQQQQSCQLQQVEIKQEVKKRKSDEKDSRMPPPAHSTGTNQPPVSQNGTFFYSDRWNLQPASKMFTPQNLPQHQGLIIHPHGHHPTPIPYFTTFPLPSHPTEYPSSVELTPLSNYSDQGPAQTTQYQQQIDEQPKVVVPNIEEELNFLNGSNPLTISRPPQLHQSKTINPANIAKPADVKSTGPGAGFMSSYIKFLQGERDSSPPPSARAPRTYSRTKIVKENKDPVNGVKPIIAPISQPPPPPPVITRLSQGDPQDDPRYFPLPKERKQNSFDSSDDGISSDDDIFRKMPPLTKDGVVKTGKKGRPCKAGGPKDKKKTKNKIKSKMKVDNVSDITDVPRRETCKRAAKDRVHLQNIITKGETIDEPEDFADSDSDPAWTPAAKEEGEEEVPSKKGKRKIGVKKKATRNLITAAAEGAGIEVDNIEEYLSDSSMTQTKKQKAAYQVHKIVNNPAPTLEDNIEANLVQHNMVRSAPVLNNNGNTTYPFKPGEFVAVEAELTQNWPIIWRCDGKSRLQKYQPFLQNGNTLYKNISTYTSWTPESKNQYISIPVRFHSQNNMEIIVEFMKHEVMVPNPEFISKCIKECEIYQDNFEVYIQTLISQSLDSNFLTEIFQEQDEYFLSNVKVIDDITINKKNKLISALRWPSQLQAALSTWPCFNLTKDFLTREILNQNCAACKQPTVSIRLLLYGQPYNSTTLEGCAPDSKAINDKDFVMCQLCGNNVELFNKITHQKYLMYIECAKRVTNKRTMDPRKDTTCILNELLADETWLNQLFSMVKLSWANVESVERNFLMRHLKSDTNSVVK